MTTSTGSTQAAPAQNGSPAPDVWEDRYAVSPPSGTTVEVDGLTISVSVWGRDARPGSSAQGPDVLLIHGGAEDQSWWDHLVPLLRGGGTVAAADLTGHGRSSRRDAYSLDTWAAESAGVAAQLLGPRPLLIGHSMGGLLAARASQLFPDRFSGVMALDSPTRRTTGGHAVRREKIAARPPRSHASLEEAMASFATYPPVPTAPRAVLHHISRTAYVPVDDRWQRTFDPRCYDRPQAPDDFVRPTPVPTTWVRAENGFIDDAMAGRIRAGLGPTGEMIVVPGVGHHLTLEEPVATAWVMSAFVQRIESADGDRRAS